MRSAYSPSWDEAANRRRLDMTRAVTIRALRSQTFRDFRLIVLLHSRDRLLSERRRSFSEIGADFLYLDATGTSAEVAWQGYRAGWAEAIGSRTDWVAMTRLDDDDALTPWALSRIAQRAPDMTSRAALIFPLGIRVWRGGYTLVRHDSNAMHTLVTPPGDRMTVYDYGHRKVRRVAPTRNIDTRIAWLWSRHPDTISGWRLSDRPLTPEIRAMFNVDWSVFGAPQKQPKVALVGRRFR